jgi:hypothetical protein
MGNDDLYSVNPLDPDIISFYLSPIVHPFAIDQTEMTTSTGAEADAIQPIVERNVKSFREKVLYKNLDAQHRSNPMPLTHYKELHVALPPLPPQQQDSPLLSASTNTQGYDSADSNIHNSFEIEILRRQKMYKSGYMWKRGERRKVRCKIPFSYNRLFNLFILDMEETLGGPETRKPGLLQE